MTIQAGEKDSIKSNMGVVNSENSLVGITYTTTDHFSTIISLINTNLMISAKIKNLGHYGTLMWDGNNPNTMQLYDIPKHAKVEIGDAAANESLLAEKRPKTMKRLAIAFFGAVSSRSGHRSVGYHRPCDRRRSETKSSGRGPWDVGLCVVRVSRRTVHRANIALNV